MHEPKQWRVAKLWLWIACTGILASRANASRHELNALSLSARQNTDLQLLITNKCKEDVYPGLSTQSGQGPDSHGFKLSPDDTRNLTVSSDWQGRIWGRTNCTFNEDGLPTRPGGKACLSGDCKGALDCVVGGDTPVTLAEFTMHGSNDQTFYDLSLVDGYNMPVAIVMIPRGIKSLEDIPPNLTNPSCVGTADLLATSDFNPYSSTGSDQAFLGTNSSFPLPFVGGHLTHEQVAKWCPWPLQVNPPMKPGDGVYPYPDDDIQRPSFNPCFSACAKWGRDQDCCQGDYNSPSKCKPSEYSHAAKSVCPDAYSYAYDDTRSTFIIPMGAGFEIVFCPGGRSTDILSHMAAVNEVLRQNPHPGSLNITELPSSATANGKKFGPASLLSLVVVLGFAIVW